MGPTFSSGMQTSARDPHALAISRSKPFSQLSIPAAQSYLHLSCLGRIACQKCCCAAKAHFPLCSGTEIHISASPSLGTMFSASLHVMAVCSVTVMWCSRLYATVSACGNIIRYCTGIACTLTEARNAVVTGSSTPGGTNLLGLCFLVGAVPCK